VSTSLLSLESMSRKRCASALKKRKDRGVRLEFRILGPLEVCGEDEGALPLGGPKQRALLALLLLNRNELVPNDRLLEGIWSGSNPESAARSLQVYVSQLRKILGGSDLLQTRSGGYSLVVNDEQLDATRFERRLREGKQLLASGQPEEAAEHLQQALTLWRGAPLADLAYEEFVQTEIARLEELRLTAREELFEAALALGRHTELVGELETLVAVEPLRERPRRQLMLALYRTGRQAEALAVYQDARRSLVEELGLEPSPELKELEAAILRQDPALVVEPPELRARRHLPAPATSLVGREKELAELGALLRRETPRLITLTGAGGTGKTRLAIQAAAALVDRFVDGVFFVGLAPMSDPELVPSSIAHRLGMQERAGRPLLEGLKEHVRDKRLLLLLDNFEHVDDAAPVVGELLAEASGLKVLVTSRAPLNLYGEHEYPVPPLTEEEAVDLFATRAEAVWAGFKLDGARPQVLELCRRLDCLPLAVELAAARSGELLPAQMLAALPQRLELATRGARDLPARQQTLRSTIEWSYGLLAPSEQALHARLSVFAGGCSLTAAQSVCDADLAELASLVEKNLVLEREQADGEARFDMLETIREYSAEQLEEAGDAEVVRQRHAEHFLALGLEAKPELKRANAGAWIVRLEEEDDNFRAALDWSLEHEPDWYVRLVDALFRFWVHRGHMREGLRRCEEGPAAARGDARARAEMLQLGATFAFFCQELSLARSLGEEALALFRQLDDVANAARVLMLLGTARSGEGEHAQGLALLEEAAALAREGGDVVVIALVLCNLGYVALAAGDRERAKATSLEAAELHRASRPELQRANTLAQALDTLGLVALFEGRLAEARAHFAESLSLTLRFRDLPKLPAKFTYLAALAARQGAFERAASLLGSVDALCERTDVDLGLEPLEMELRQQTEAEARRNLTDEGFSRAREEGRKLPVEEAAAAALDAVAPG
jgi:predicted ATPase/DNA-binding SARP family transcriptional activator